VAIASLAKGLVFVLGEDSWLARLLLGPRYPEGGVAINDAKVLEVAEERLDRGQLSSTCRTSLALSVELGEVVVQVSSVDFLYAPHASLVLEIPDEQVEVGSVATASRLGEVAQSHIGSLVVEKRIPQALIRLDMWGADRD